MSGRSSLGLCGVGCWPGGSSVVRASVPRDSRARYGSVVSGWPNGSRRPDFGNGIIHGIRRERRGDKLVVPEYIWKWAEGLPSRLT